MKGIGPVMEAAAEPGLKYEMEWEWRMKGIGPVMEAAASAGGEWEMK